MDQDIADDWTCPTCGAIVRYGQETCPVCRTTIDGEVPPGWLEVVAWFVGYGLLVCLGWTAFFALCGLVCALATGDWGFMGAITVFGLIAGVLFGIGGIIVQIVRCYQEPVDEEPNEAASAAFVGGHVLGALIPILKPFTLLFSVLVWVVTKNHRKQRAGRGKRALLGAIVLGLLGAGMATFLFMFFVPPQGGMTIWEAIIGVLVLAGIGAVVGLLSDSW
jgi:MFS family permease